MTNPLLDFTGLPRFDTVQPEHVAPAIRQLIAENRSLIETLTRSETPATWTDFMAPMTDAGERLSRAWGIVGHLHSVNDVPAWREAYNGMLPEISGFYADLGQNLALFAKLKALAASPEYDALAPVRRRIVDNDLRDFRLSGAELDEAQKPRFKEIQEELSALSVKFSENLLDATNAHAEWVDDAAGLAGLPEDVKEAARAAAEKEGKPGWKFSLQAPAYIPVMQYAEDRNLRARIYRAYTTRAAEFGPAEWNNTPLIEQILALRAEESRLLGYANFAEVSLVPKMAESPAQVAAFLRDLAQKARPFAERDMAELRQFAREQLGLDTLESWDLAWASEKLKQARYAFSDEEVKQYFPEPKVLAGLFRVIESLFGVTLAPDTAPVWHPDVRFFRILRDGQLVGQCYLDLYARETKRGGAWMDGAIDRRRLAAGIQTPVTYLNCNFPAPVNGKAATFSHDDVITLFHECGHGLHHLLTQVEELPVSGINGVEWDAVELPSQFMENFCWEWDVLQGMTAHAASGEPLPRALYDKMIAAKNFQSGMQMLRQIEFSLFDLLLHSEFTPGGDASFMDLLAQVRREVAVVVPPEWNRFPQSFSHIFAGGYGAGYFSYKWAEVLSADAFEAFEEAAKTTGSVLDAATGRHFWQEILAVGGSRPALESFKAFRGREPRPDALLRHNGMTP
ncbi:M3 family metallopeptidase [Denitratisoma oestradiolicum]|uniref:oligopeptidase A n=1 Tax=Denitratisoma oestradiolicum TaxID=311182 RepID=A0A6S6YJ42_9PROT|nr:M3 family metallopeptidase [Denitratisoma oestradiolicum]TWO81078.1 oligopeptidase A [Denitratisoma oestradiolicum]CAB1367754.1 Oligopeptidase A [Denitratisoma oestradiolicum]